MTATDPGETLLITPHIKRGASRLQGKFAQISRIGKKNLLFPLEHIYDNVFLAVCTEGFKSLGDAVKHNTHDVKQILETVESNLRGLSL